MPEGDTVWLAAKQLHEALAGHVLTATDFRVPRLATTDLSGATVTDVASRGKHVLTRLDRGLTLHTHFEMDGTWRLYPRGERWRGGPGWQVRVVLETDAWQAVGYRLPVVELFPTREEQRRLGHLGPDLLGADWNLDEALRRLSDRADRAVGPALLDQRNLAGIGNLYKTETLFLAGVTPWTPVGAIDDLPAVVCLAQRLLDGNKHQWSQPTTGSRRRGEEHWVFERGGRPCRRCGTCIAQAMQSEPEQPSHARVCYWCSQCQHGPAPPTTRA